ncbi:MAG: MopE-related protein [Saprospiraceae bacterium]
MGSWFEAKSQCINPDIAFPVIFPPINNTATTAACISTNQYVQLQEVVPGKTYQFTSSVATDYLTLTEGDNTVIAHGPSPLVAPVTSVVVKVHVRTNAACGTSASCRNITIQCQDCLLPPTNDNCSNAIEVFPADSLVCVDQVWGSTYWATPSGNSTPCASSTAADTWYRFTATSNAHMVKVQGYFNSQPIVNVRSGACPGTYLNCSFYIGSVGGAALAFYNLTIGAEYLIQVTSSVSFTYHFNVCVLTIPPAPVNDNCSGAITLIPDPNPVCATPTPGTTLGASPNSPNFSACFSTTPDDDVWYKFTATSAQHNVTVVSGPGFDAAVQLRSGTTCSGSSVSCYNTTGTGGTEVINLFNLTVGGQYFLRIYDTGTLQFGNFTVCVSTPPPPPVNDDCSGAITLPVGPVNSCTPLSGTTNNASNSGVDIGVKDVWYRFTATQTRHFMEVNCAPGFNAAVNLRSGACNGVSIATVFNNNAGETTNIVFDDLTVGEVYLVRIYHVDGNATGDFTICVTEADDPPANDDCANAEVITPVPDTDPGGVVMGSTILATDSGIGNLSCGGNPDDDVWYTFTAVATTHQIHYTPLSVGFNSILMDLLTGGCNGTYAPFCNFFASASTVFTLEDLMPGTAYAIRIYGDANYGGRGDFSLRITYGVLQPPACTALTDPDNGATMICPNTPLSWSPSTNASGYRLRVGTTPGGSNLVNNLDLGNVVTYQHPSNWPVSATIYVTITPYNAAGDATGCAEESFQTTSVNPQTYYYDSDGDGFGNPAAPTALCVQLPGYVTDNTDCNDALANVSPIAPENCNGIDDDCDTQIDEGVTNTYYADTDGDGFGDPGTTIQGCSPPIGYVADNTDCEDGNDEIYPGAPEVCNSTDDDCDSQTDEGLTTTFYADTDGDGYGNPGNTIQACSAPSGYVSNNTDCNDGNANVNPGATEICNGVDDDCDTQTDEGVTNTYYADADGDGFGNPASTIQGCTPPMGYVANNTDCNDANDEVYPGATEICNGVDDDCDTQTDEGVTNTYYADTDGDGFGNPGSTVQACTPPMGYVANNTDCNDANDEIYPGATEICNGTDDDCDTQTDEGVTNTYYADTDGDGYGNPGSPVQACLPPMGYVANNTDCNDGNANVNPGTTETCNGTDDDCDAQTDEGVQTTWYRDMDGDGFGNLLVTQLACTQPNGFVANNTDCDDNDALEKPGQVWYKDTDNDGYAQTGAATLTQCLRPVGYKTVSQLTAITGDCNDSVPTINPGASEGCNSIDDDCDGQIDEGLNLGMMCTVGFGICARTGTIICVNGQAVCSVVPGTPSTEICDGFDNDCDGQTDEGFNIGMSCTVGVGVCARTGTIVCVNGQAVCNAAPGTPSTEICDGFDNDCDGTADEGVVVFYYADADNDGFGNPSASQMSCFPIAGYVTNNTDCNDNSAAINPAAMEVCDGVDNNCDGQTDEGVKPTWYRDLDNDGFGDPAMTQLACSQPNGYVSNNTDCDDNDALEKPGQTWYADLDNDGYSNGNTLTQCLRPNGYKLANELTATSGDCNDGAATINPAATEICDGVDNDCDSQTDEGVQTTYYRDMDGDGFGNPAMTQSACTQPGGYVSNNSDCDDNDALEKPGQTWYADLDNDGYSTGSTLTQCLRPAGYKAAIELTAISGDCNDAVAAINPAAAEICDGIDNDCDGQIDDGVLNTWYRDMDGDGFGNPSNTTTACSQPVGYVANNTDCDDNDALEKPGQVWYKDTDNDGYAANGATPLTQCLRPAGYKVAGELTSTTGDCNDNAAAINPGASEVCDGVDNNCNGSIDDGVLTTFYRDMDGDGFGNPAMTQMACSQPVGHVANNSDCDDNDPLEKPGQVWYKDTDNDGYAQTGAATLTQCLRPAGYKLAGELIATTGDCNDNAVTINPAASEICEGIDNDCDGLIDEGVKTQYFADTDGDGYGDPNAMITECSQPQGYVLNADDCDDAMAGVNPAAEEICDNLDNDCNGVIDDQGGVSGGNWSNGNVGTSNGNANYPPCNAQPQDIFTIGATGFSTSSSDKLHAVYQTLCGNGEIIARVLTVNGGGWGGIMLRETLDPGSKKVALKTQLSSSIRREIRTINNGAVSILNFNRPQHVWLRLTRSGSNFVGYTSVNGTNWSFAFAATISMDGCIYAGLFAESINNAVTTTATFDQVEVNGPAQPLLNGAANPAAGLDGQTLEIFPNPTTGYVQLNFGTMPMQPVSIQVLSATGSNGGLLKKLIATEPSIGMDLSELPDGVYFVRISVPGQLPQVRRIVLAKLDGIRE